MSFYEKQQQIFSCKDMEKYLLIFQNENVKNDKKQK